MPGINRHSVLGYLIIAIFLTLCLTTGCNSWKNTPASSQNPSPMTESIRSHDRVSADNCIGERIAWELQDKPLRLFIPENFTPDSGINLNIHIHGMPDVSEYAICHKSSHLMLTINGGSSSDYENLFKEGDTFTQLLNQVAQKSGVKEFSSITLSGWSAGYGAIRALIPRYTELIANIILLDGLHTSYIPENQTLYKGGKLDSIKLGPFLQFAEKAMKGEKQMLITHSSVFPGTFASTTECTEYLIKSLGLKRNSVLQYGAVGMQQVGEIKSGNLLILSYAGNSAPDHVDHLHALRYFLEKFTSPPID